jgi:membrane protease YdiL (CAAX protease family)
LNRRNRWQVVLLLVFLQFFSNLAAIPLHYNSIGIYESVSSWMLWTLVSVPVIWLAMYIATKIGLGAPILEGYLAKDMRTVWIRDVASYTILGILAVLPVYILVNSWLPESTYPPGWMLLLASVQAGVREEIFSRLLLMSLFTWVGNQLSGNEGGKPTSRLIWSGNIISAVIFGLAHLDNTPYSDELLLPLIGVFSISAFLGLLFGWLYWRYGIEAAILAHFMFDAIGSVLLIPVFLWGNLFMKAILLSALVICGVYCWSYFKG